MDSGDGAGNRGMEQEGRMSEWISVKDALPNVGTRNLTVRYDYVTNTQFCDLLLYDGFWWNGLIKGDFAVTHWMPLPEPPEVYDDD